jgi:hypothetical protein
MKTLMIIATCAALIWAVAMLQGCTVIAIPVEFFFPSGIAWDIGKDIDESFLEWMENNTPTPEMKPWKSMKQETIHDESDN